VLLCKQPTYLRRSRLLLLILHPPIPLLGPLLQLLLPLTVRLGLVRSERLSGLSGGRSDTAIRGGRGGGGRGGGETGNEGGEAGEETGEDEEGEAVEGVERDLRAEEGE
jgi:hypothetical protein